MCVQLHTAPAGVELGKVSRGFKQNSLVALDIPLHPSALTTANRTR